MRVSAGNLVDRLIDADRNGVTLQTWGLDSLGNWAAFTEGTANQTRAFNEANEIDVDNPHSNAAGNSISGDFDWVDPVYDAAGNMISGPKPGAETTRLHFVYDAWNRMTAAYTDDGDGVFEPGGDDALAGSYAYDGQGRRIQKTVDSVPQDFYWNEQFQNIETRQNGNADPLDQIIYDIRYVDAPIVRFHDGNADGDYADTEDNTDSILFVTSDANFNVTGVVKASTGDAVEHYAFTPYGERTIFTGNWELTTGNYSWDRGHQGLAYDSETGLVYNRARMFEAVLGRFAQRDPAEYADGCNLQEYASSQPISQLDPIGLRGGGAAPVAPPVVRPPPPRPSQPRPRPSPGNPGEPVRPDPGPAPVDGGQCTLKIPPPYNAPPGYEWVMVPILKSPDSCAAPSWTLVPKRGGKYDPCVNPTGDCTKAEHGQLQKAVDDACKVPRACQMLPGNKPNCSEWKQFLAQNQKCFNARWTMMLKCWGGGDSRHQNQTAEAGRALSTCRLLIDALCKDS